MFRILDLLMESSVLDERKEVPITFDVPPNTHVVTWWTLVVLRLPSNFESVLNRR